MSRPVAFLSDYGLADEFVGVCKARDARPRARRRGSSTSPTTSRPTTCGRARSPSCGPSSTSPTARSCWPSSTPGSAPTGGSSPSRSRAGHARRPRQRPAGAGGRHGSAGRTTVVSLDERRVPPPGARAHVRGPRRARPGRWPPGRGRRRSATSASRSTRPGSCRASWAARDVTERRDRRPRSGGSTASATASSTSGPEELDALGVAPGGAARGAHGRPAPSRPAGSHTYADAKPSELVLVVDSYGLLLARPRPHLRRGGVRAPGGLTRDPRAAGRRCERARGLTRGSRHHAPRDDDRDCGSARADPRGRLRAVRPPSLALTNTCRERPGQKFTESGGNPQAGTEGVDPVMDPVRGRGLRDTVGTPDGVHRPPSPPQGPRPRPVIALSGLRTIRR